MVMTVPNKYFYQIWSPRKFLISNTLCTKISSDQRHINVWYMWLIPRKTDIKYCPCHQVSTRTCTTVTMAEIQFLTILFTVTCFLCGVVSVTDKEFKVSDVQYWIAILIHHIHLIFGVCGDILHCLCSKFRHLHSYTRRSDKKSWQLLAYSEFYPKIVITRIMF